MTEKTRQHRRDGDAPLGQIFIGGTGRSGTTVLKRLLLAHPEIVGYTDELRLIVDPDGLLDLITALTATWSPYEGDLAITRFRDVLKAVRHRNSGYRYLAKMFDTLGASPARYWSTAIEADITHGSLLDVFEPLFDAVTTGTSRGRWIGYPAYHFPARMHETRPLTSEEANAVARQTIDHLYKRLPGADAASAWIEDTPYNILRAGELARVFPDMTFVHICRDPRDVVSSYATKGWGGENAVIAAQRVKHILDRWTAVKKDVPPEQLFEISLEDLVSDPRATMAGFLGRVGITFAPEMERIRLDKANAGRWRSDLPAADLARIDDILADYLPETA